MRSESEALRVRVHANAAGSGATGTDVVVLAGQSWVGFKREVGKALGLGAHSSRRVFLGGGAEVDSLEELQEGDLLWISAGEDYYAAGSASDVGAGSSNKSGGGSSSRGGSRKSKGGTSVMRVALLGGGGVGKSALTLRFIRDFFVPVWDPTIEDAYQKVLTVDGRQVVLEILDTAGQEDFEALRPQWMSDKDGFIFVAGLDDAATLEDLRPYVELNRMLHGGGGRPVVVAGNKRDLVEDTPASRQIASAELETFAAEWGAVSMETSAKTGESVDALFETFVRHVWAAHAQVTEEAPEPAPRARQWWQCTLL